MLSVPSSLFNTSQQRKAENKSSESLIQLSGSVAESVADNSSWTPLQTRVSFTGFADAKFAIRTREPGEGVPVQLLTPDNGTVTVHLCPNSLKKRFPQMEPKEFPEFMAKRQRPTAQALHATLSPINPQITEKDLQNALWATNLINKSSPDDKISHRQYNAKHSNYPIPRSILCVSGKPYLLLNRTKEGDPDIATTNGKQVRYCLGLHDNKLYALISEKSGSDDLAAEVPCLAKLQGVSNVVQFHGTLEKESEKRTISKKYMIQPFYAGDLSKSTISETKKLTHAKQLTAALAKIHERGIIHRDLKPDNVFLDTKEESHIGDFGASCQRFGDERRNDRTGGTFPYIAPEFARAHLSLKRDTSVHDFHAMVDSPLDVYGMGCVLHELFFGPITQNPAFPNLEGKSRTQSFQILAKLGDWMEEPQDTTTCEGRRNHIIWSMVRANPAERITAAEAAARFAAL